MLIGRDGDDVDGERGVVGHVHGVGGFAGLVAVDRIEARPPDHAPVTAGQLLIHQREEPFVLRLDGAGAAVELGFEVALELCLRGLNGGRSVGGDAHKEGGLYDVLSHVSLRCPLRRLRVGGPTGRYYRECLLPAAAIAGGVRR
jgi:hypothetical protein